MSNSEEVIQQLIEDLTLYPNRNTVILVEDREDASFGRRILLEYAPHIQPNFPLFSITGKGNLKQYTSYVSKQVLICVDSDNDGYHTTGHSEWLHPRKPFIYQTYAHSRESHFIHPNNLKQSCDDLIGVEYDFPSDFAEISEALYNWLIIWLFFTDIDRKWLGSTIEGFGNEISWDKLKDIVKVCLTKANFENAKNISDVRKISTELKVRIIEHKEYVVGLIKENGYPQFVDELKTFQKNCPINPNESLWFIQGHCAFDDVIVPYFNKIIQILSKDLANKATSKEKRNEWKKKSELKESYRNELSLSYPNCFAPSQECLFFRQIQEDLKTDFLK